MLTAGVVDVGGAVVCCAVVADADAVVLAAVRVVDDVAAVRSDDVEVASEAVVAVAFCADVTAVVVTLAGLADVTAGAGGDGLVSVIMLPLSDVGGLGGLSVCANMYARDSTSTRLLNWYAHLLSIQFILLSLLVTTTSMRASSASIWVAILLSSASPGMSSSAWAVRIPTTTASASA